MKREYTKPIIVFENFSMSTNIAAGCEHITNNHVENVCGYLVDQRDPTEIHVFMVGMEEGLFPSYMTIVSGSREELEEERRLLYVGMTRAKDHLHLYYIRERYGKEKTWKQ